MSIDLSKLSAKELFELAQQREKEEQQAAERDARINELQNRREAMLNEHKSVLLLTDKKIRDMQAQRDKLIADHEQAVAEIDKEIVAMGGNAPTAQTAADAGAAAKSTATSGGDDDTAKLKATLRQIMNKRPYISASLLKEQLASYGIKPANFNKDLEQWVRNGWFENKGQSNYSLGKRF
jgi:L-lactate utilization protein LutB